MSESYSASRRADEFDTRTALFIVAAVVITIMIWVTIDALLPPERGPGPFKIANLGQLQITEMPVSKGAKSWFTRVRQEDSGSQYVVCMDDGSSTTEFDSKLFATRPAYLAVGQDGDSLLFAVGSAASGKVLHEIWRCNTAGDFEEITIQDGVGITAVDTAGVGSNSGITRPSDRGARARRCPTDRP